LVVILPSRKGTIPGSGKVREKFGPRNYPKNTKDTKGMSPRELIHRLLYLILLELDVINQKG
jgi:hypothetical protein